MNGCWAGYQVFESAVQVETLTGAGVEPLMNVNDDSQQNRWLNTKYSMLDQHIPCFIHAPSC